MNPNRGLRNFIYRGFINLMLTLYLQLTGLYRIVASTIKRASQWMLVKTVKPSFNSSQTFERQSCRCCAIVACNFSCLAKSWYVLEAVTDL